MKNGKVIDTGLKPFLVYIFLKDFVVFPFKM